MTCALATGLGLALALAGGPAHAWSVPVSGGDAVIGSTPIGDISTSSDAAMSDPLVGIGDRLGMDIEAFSQPDFSSTAHFGSEMLQWAQVMTFVALPVVAALGSKKHSSGGKQAFLDHLLQKHPLLPLPIKVTQPPPPVPEPRSIWLFAVSSLLLFAAFSRRRVREEPARGS